MVWKSDMPGEEPLDSRDFFLNDDPVSDSGEYSMVATSNLLIILETVIFLIMRYLQDLYTLRIKNLISSHNGSSAPFFLYASSQNTHIPLQVPKVIKVWEE